MYKIHLAQHILNRIRMRASNRRVVTPGTLRGVPLHQDRRGGHGNKAAVNIRHLLTNGVNITNHTRQSIGASRGGHGHDLRGALRGIGDTGVHRADVQRSLRQQGTAIYLPTARVFKIPYIYQHVIIQSRSIILYWSRDGLPLLLIFSPSVRRCRCAAHCHPRAHTDSGRACGCE